MLYKEGCYIIERTGKNNNKTYYQGSGTWKWSKSIEKAYIFKTINSALDTLDYLNHFNKVKGETIYYNIIKYE